MIVAPAFIAEGWSTNKRVTVLIGEKFYPYIRGMSYADQWQIYAAEVEIRQTLFLRPLKKIAEEFKGTWYAENEFTVRDGFRYWRFFFPSRVNAEGFITAVDSFLDENKSVLELGSAWTMDTVNEEIKRIAEKCNVEVEDVRKGQELLRVKPDADRVATVEISKQAIKEIDGWTVYEIIANPQIYRTLSTNPKELYKVAEQVKQMAEFAEMLIAKKMKLKVKKD